MLENLKKCVPIQRIQETLQQIFYVDANRHIKQFKTFDLQVKNHKIFNKLKTPLPKYGLSEIPSLRYSVIRDQGDFRTDDPQSFVVSPYVIIAYPTNWKK